MKKTAVSFLKISLPILLVIISHFVFLFQTSFATYDLITVGTNIKNQKMFIVSGMEYEREYILINESELKIEDELVKYIVLEKEKGKRGKYTIFFPESNIQSTLISSTDFVKFHSIFRIPNHGGYMDSTTKRVKLINSLIISYLRISELNNSLEKYSMVKILLIVIGYMLYFNNLIFRGDLFISSKILRTIGICFIIISGIIPFIYIL